MTLRKISMLVTIILITTLVYIPTIFAESTLVDPDIPDSWYEGPDFASNLGITEYDESPMLEEKVATGELPAAKERLPEDPPVVETYSKIGNYGGMLETWGITLDEWDSTGAGIMMGNGAHYARATPDGSDMVPYLVKDWEFSDEGKTLTLYLYEGMKWSDGEPFTSEDFMYWWEHEAKNEDLNPTPPEKWDPSLLDVTKKGKYEISFHYGEPALPAVSAILNSYMQYGVEHPSHYNKQFHYDFVDKEKLMEEAEEEGLDTWAEYYAYMTEEAEFHPERGNRPTLRPYYVTERTSTYIIGERNPYFPFVDQEGNQLPYIDKIRLNRVNDTEMQVTKQATGEADLAGRQVRTKDIPLYKGSEEKYGFKLLMYESARYGLVLNFDLTHTNSQMREIFQDKRFRRAVSVGIDREEINDKLYYGKAYPMQLSLVPGSKMATEEHRNAYIEHNPEQARQWLNEMGMEDVDGDGFREKPNGEEFNPELIFMDRYGPTIEFGELFKSYMEDIGINITLNEVDPSLYVQRAYSSKFDLKMTASDKAVDIGFAAEAASIYAPSARDTGWQSSWPLWGSYYATDGEEGEEPPEEFKELHDLLIKFRTSSTMGENWRDLGRKLLDAQAENLWALGIVSMGPQGIIINEDLENVPKKGLWNDAIQRTQPLYPIQFFFREGSDKLQ